MHLHVIVAMNQEQPLHFIRILAGKKLAQILIITMGAHAPYSAYFCVHFVNSAIDLNFFGSFEQTTAQGTRFAVTRKQNGIPAVFNIVAYMMLYPACIRHTAGRNDHHRTVPEIQQFRFID